MTTSAIVLCGGGSTRMGQDKGRLPVGDESMLARVVRLVSGVTNDVVVVSRERRGLAALAAPHKGVPYTPAPHEGVPYTPVPHEGVPYTPVPHEGVPYTPAPHEGVPYTPAPHEGVPYARVVCDPVDGLGPLAGLVTGLRAILHERAFVTACDMPLLRPALVDRLLDLAGDHDVCVPIWEGHVMTMCAVYRASVVSEADRLLGEGERSVRGLIDSVDARRVDAADLRDVDPELESFFSCDTPERYQQLLRIVQGQR